MDDTFVMFDSELEYDRLYVYINMLHPALRFIVEKEQNNSLNFPDVSVEKLGTGFLSRVYRKPTLTRKTSVGIPSAKKQERLAL